MRVTFTQLVDDFEQLTADEQKDVYLDALWSLINANAAWLRKGRRFANGFPRLYDAGIRFAISDEERRGEGNTWPNIPAIVAVGVAHCVGLSCWRIAELRVRDGIDARPAVKVSQEVIPGVGPVDEFHVAVLLPDGTIEDPSVRLGMP